MILMFSCVVYRLRVRLYKRFKFHPFNRDECVGEDMDFDVYLCCSSEDHNPHGLHILEMIESRGYRDCYHLRDFLAGGAITENMIQSVVRSKRTVCLVSNNFLQRLDISLGFCTLFTRRYLLFVISGTVSLNWHRFRGTTIFWSKIANLFSSLLYMGRGG